MVLLGIIAAVLWIVHCFWRMQLSWEKSEAEILRLGFQFRTADRKRAEQKRALEKLVQEITYIQKTTGQARDDAQKHRENLQKIVPPPPREIAVPREYPTSASEVPWMVELKLRSGIPVADAKAQVWVLFWAPANSKTAYTRSAGVLEEFNLYRVENISRFGPDNA